MILSLLSEFVPYGGLKLGLRMAPDKLLCDTTASFSLSKHKESVLLQHFQLSYEFSKGLEESRGPLETIFL